MPRRGENIYKRKDGRWEDVTKTGLSLTEKQSILPFTASPILKFGLN